MLIDSYHSGKKYTRRSRTMFLIYMNMYYLIGTQCSNLSLRHQYLVKSLWSWKVVFTHFVPFNVSWGWRLSECPGQQIFMEIICWLSIIPQSLNQHLRRSIIPIWHHLPLPTASQVSPKPSKPKSYAISLHSIITPLPR